MSRQYADVCMAHGCTAKVFPKETGPIEKKIGSPDLMILFTRTVSHKMVHKMVQGAVKAAKKKFHSHFLHTRDRRFGRERRSFLQLCVCSGCEVAQNFDKTLDYS